jgi:signal transduction histidine kinase
LEVLHDDLGFVEQAVSEENTPITTGWPWTTLVDRDSFQKALNFTIEVKKKGLAFDWEMNVPGEGGLVPLHFAGALTGDTMLIVADQSSEGLVTFHEKMVRTSNQQLNSLREVLEERLISATAGPGDGRLPEGGRSETLYDEISRLNNELVTMQRKLARRNAELERLNEKAEREIARRRETQDALARSNRDLERSNQDLEQFASVVSHDLREPLRAVTGFLRLLEERTEDKLDGREKRFVEYALDGADRMQEMIGALLDLSRVKTRGEDPVPTEAEAMVDRAVEALHRAIENAEAEVTYDALPTVKADKAQLAQVFQNLIANAIKFQREGVPPRIHIAAEREGDKWVFSVVDNGIGIDPEQVERIFQIFQRLHTEEEYEGMGIGLALCRRIVERHGGRIWVESEIGEGSTFTFTLPA